MARLPFPRSLVGQTLLVAVFALLVGQAVSAVLLWRASEDRREAALIQTLAFQLAAPNVEGDVEGGGFGERRGRRGRQLPPALRQSRSPSGPAQPGEDRVTELENDLLALLANRGVEAEAVQIVERPVLGDPALARAVERFPRLYDRMSARGIERIVVAGLKRSSEAEWRVVRTPAPRPDRAGIATILFQTALLVLVLSVLLWFALRRIARPLARLAERTERFGQHGSASDELEPSGPQDVRALIEAHTAMERRIAAMLDEKDVMLGAIGHDLKTPLAALRVRIENVADASERDRLSAIIAEMRDTLDDILHLARVGRSDAPLEHVQLGALAAAVVEEFEDMGEPVQLGATERMAAPVRLVLVKRALRNLVTNALRYAGSAEVLVRRENGFAVIEVRDDGPGIPAEELARMTQPFARGENSRNRSTGGAGLGLALVKAIAQQHGGTLDLKNRAKGGLSAAIRLPL